MVDDRVGINLRALSPKEPNRRRDENDAADNQQDAEPDDRQSRNTRPTKEITDSHRDNDID
jgi:hypothetical protein